MGDEKKPKPAGVWPTVKPFVNGGASGMLATCVIQPIDMIKVKHEPLAFLFHLFVSMESSNGSLELLVFFSLFVGEKMWRVDCDGPDEIQICVLCLLF